MATRADQLGDDGRQDNELAMPRSGLSPTTTVFTSLSRFDRFVVKLIALGIVVLGFAVAVGAPWYVKPVGVPTVLLGVAVFCYPDPREHLRLYRRLRNGPAP